MLSSSVLFSMCMCGANVHILIVPRCTRCSDHSLSLIDRKTAFPGTRCSDHSLSLIDRKTAFPGCQYFSNFNIINTNAPV